MVGNIRPYLKKIWFSDREGGASADVLVFVVKPEYCPQYVYYSMFRDDFFSHMMRGKKGSLVSLTILRKNENKPLIFNLRREIIKIKTVKEQLLEPGYGYVRLVAFQDPTEKDMIKFFSKTFWAYQYQDMSKLSAIIRKMLGLLEEYKFIISNEKQEEFQSAAEMFNYHYKPTLIGKRVAELYIDPLTAHFIIQSLI